MTPKSPTSAIDNPISNPKTLQPKIVGTDFPLLREYLAYMQAVKERSPLTMKEYRYDIIMFFRFLKIDRKLVPSDIEFNQIFTDDIDITFIQSIDQNDLYAFLIFLSQKRQASAANRARKSATLKSFFKYLYLKRQLLSADPAYELESPKIPKRLPRYLNLEESVHLLAQTSESQKQTKERDMCILTLFLNCGLRLSEVTNLNIDNIFENKLRVIGKGNKERLIYLNHACLKSLEEWLQIRSTLLLKDPEALFISRLGKRLSHQMIQYSTKELLRQSGIDPTLYSVHKLRHTAATLLYQHGEVDIRSLQIILGHASVSTTQIYTHVDDKSLEKAMNKNPLANL